MESGSAVKWNSWKYLFDFVFFRNILLFVKINDHFAKCFPSGCPFGLDKGFNRRYHKIFIKYFYFVPLLGGKLIIQSFVGMLLTLRLGLKIWRKTFRDRIRTALFGYCRGSHQVVDTWMFRNLFRDSLCQEWLFSILNYCQHPLP